MNEIKLTEEQAEELCKNIQYYLSSTGIAEEDTITYTMKAWKQKGYIKQSRENELKDKLKLIYDKNYNINYCNVEKALILQRELIEILENKIKEKK